MSTTLLYKTNNDFFSNQQIQNQQNNQQQISPSNNNNVQQLQQQQQQLSQIFTQNSQSIFAPPQQQQTSPTNSQRDEQENQELKQAINSKRDQFRAQIRKQCTNTLLLSKRMAVAENNQTTQLNKSIKEFLPKYIQQSPEKLQKYLQDIANNLKQQVKQIQDNIQNNININFRQNNPQQQIQQPQNQNINNNQFGSNSSCSSTSSVKSNLSQKCNIEIYQDILVNLSKISKIVQCEEEDPVYYLIHDLKIQDILYTLVQQQNQLDIQREICLMLSNIVQKQSYVWAPMVEQSEILYDIFRYCFMQETSFRASVTGLGNICIDYPQIIDQLLQQNIHQKIIHYYNQLTNQIENLEKEKKVENGPQIKRLEKSIEHLLWFMNIFINYTSDNEDILQQFLPIIDEVLSEKKITFGNRGRISYALDSLKSFTNNSEDYRIQTVIKSLNNFSTLFEYYQNDIKDEQIISLSLHISSNLTNACDQIILDLINMGILEFLTKMLKSNKERHRVEAAFCIRNIMTCDLEDIHIKFCQNESLVSTLYTALQSDSFRVKKQLYYAFTNFFQRESDILSVYVNSLDVQDVNCLLHCLDGFNALLTKGENLVPNRNPIQYELDGLGFNNMLEGLQNHHSDDVYNKVQQIIDRFYTYSEESIVHN